MDKTDMAADLRAVFRGLVRGGTERDFEIAWRAIEADAKAAHDYAAGRDDPDEWQEDLERFTENLGKAMKVGRTVKPKGKPRESSEDGYGSDELGRHQRARECALYAEASRSANVTAWRAKYLPGGVLVDDGEIRRWFADQTGEPVIVEWQPFEDRAEAIASAGNGAQELPGLADTLAKRFGWDHASAVTFLLSGAMPAAPMIRVRLETGTSRPYGAANLITLRVHPSVPVGEVAAAYTKAQRGEFSGVRGRDTRQHYRRPRLLDARTAEAVEASLMVPGGPVRQNAALSDPYRNAVTFSGVVRRAVKKLLEPRGTLAPSDAKRILARTRPRSAE